MGGTPFRMSWVAKHARRVWKRTEGSLTAYEKEGVEFIPLSKAALDPIYDFNPNVARNSGSQFTYQVLKSRGQGKKDAGIEGLRWHRDELLKLKA